MASPCRLLYLALLVQCYVCVLGTQSSPVKVMGGTVVGTEEQSALGRAFSAFRSVPYAASTGGENRFKVRNSWMIIIFND